MPEQHEYIPNTAEDQRQMLATVGLASLDDLFSDIPRAVLARYQPLGLKSLTELEAQRLLHKIAQENADPEDYVSFLGGGLYDHYVPSVVGHLLLRSEFFTTYTPYQAELSQGTLTWMFEFQSMICELTAMDVANSSLYDGGSAAGEALLMAKNVTGRSRFLVARSLNPRYRAVLQTYAWGAGLTLMDVPFAAQGQLDRACIAEHARDAAGLILQSPNFFGVIEDLRGLKALMPDGLLIVSANPVALGLLKPPGETGADIVVGEGQMLGNAINFGGPLLGIFATRKEYMRKMPGRLSGRTVDSDGNTGYVMALQTREQHIRRERATSNICTNQALCALAATIYLALLGKTGLGKLARLNLQKAHYLAQRITRVKGFSLAFRAPFFNEFVVRTPKSAGALIKRMQRKGYLAGIDLSPFGLAKHLLIAVTEKRTKAEMDGFVSALKGAA